MHHTGKKHSTYFTAIVLNLTEWSATHLPPWPHAATLSVVKWLKTLSSVVNIFTDEEVSNCLFHSAVVQSLALPVSWEIIDGQGLR